MSYKVLPVTNSQPVNQSNKSLVLTEEGHEKLLGALDVYFPDGYSDSGIARETGIHKHTVGKILNRRSGATLSSIEAIFDLCNIDVDQETDTKEFSLTNSIQKRNHNKKNNFRLLPELKGKLFQINYQKQCKIFEDFIENNYSIGAFLIHGEYQHGQFWLANRLVEQSFALNNNSLTEGLIRIFLPPYKPTSEQNIEEIWRILGLSLNLGNQASPKQCVEGVLRFLQNNQIVIISICNVDSLYTEEGCQLIELFWKPLVARFETQSRGTQRYLLMLLIDNRGYTSKWKVEWAENLESWIPQQPFKLPIIDNFGGSSTDILARWIVRNSGLLGCCEANIESVIQWIWENSFRGIPELVFKAICEQCHCEWSDIEKTLILKED